MRRGKPWFDLSVCADGWVTLNDLNCVSANEAKRIRIFSRDYISTLAVNCSISLNAIVSAPVTMVFNAFYDIL